MKSRVARRGILQTLTIILLAASTTPEIQAQLPQTDDSPYTVAERGPHHRVWARATWATNALGNVTARTNTYTELTTGLHVKQADGSWAEASEGIVLTASGAAATNTQHQVFFAANPNTTGAVDLITPDGKRLRSRILGLSYFDTATGQAVLIAETTNSIGQLFYPNQVIYTNAFDDVQADVQYIDTKAGLEQNIVLRAQLPPPEEFNLNRATTRLQVLTEFFDPPAPQKYAVNRPGAVTDEIIDFGLMKIGPGKAFATGDEAKIGRSFRVTKQWKVMDDRTFLVEEVPFTTVEAQISALRERGRGASVKPRRQGENLFAVLRTVSPAQRTNAMTGTMQVARLSEQQPGFVLDYTIASSATNFTFQGDTTYLLSGAVNLSGTTTLEGGTVIKHGGASAWRILDLLGPLVCKTSPYRPAIFTSRDDDSVGETIDASSGVPSIDAYFYIAADGPGSGTAWDFKCARMAYGYAGFVGYDGLDVLVRHCQFVSNSFGAGGVTGDVSVENVLFSACDIPIYANENVSTRHVTVDGYSTYVIAETGFSSLTLTNCLIVGTGAWTGRFYGSGSLPTPVLDHTTQLTSASGVFQTIAAGAHYLANGSTNRNAGTTNINADLLAALNKKTTYPPIVLSNITIYASTNIVPQAQRDNDGSPDRGYHYDPVDYLTHWYTVSNAVLTVSDGAAIACYNDTGIWIADGSSILSIGTPLAPNWFTRYSLVQEQPISLGSGPGLAVNSAHFASLGPTGVFRFSRFSCPAGFNDYHLYHYDYATNYDLFAFDSLSVRDCEFWNGLNLLGGSVTRTGAATLNNNLFHRSRVWAYNTAATQSLNFSNNLVFGMTLTFHGPASDLWKVYDNAFDTCSFFLSGYSVTNGYNGYINCESRLNPTNAFDMVLTNFTYATGPLGDYYQVATNLINAGSLTNAGLAGLYHYTTTTNQVKEANSALDIGYHYVVVSNGLPVDTDGDSQADYFEDTNGNGVFNTGDFGDFTNFLYSAANFIGVNQTGASDFDRPDSMGAVGSNYFMEVINFAVAVYAKSNGTLVASTNLNAFLGLIVPAGQPYEGTYPDPSAPYPYTGDPRVLYDHTSQRWFACAIDGSSQHVLLAVSKTSDPVGTGGASWVSDNWDHYLVPTGSVPTNNYGMDQDKLAVDGNGVYIVCDALAWLGGLTEKLRIAALPKTSLLGSTSIVQTNFIFDAPSNTLAHPAVNFDAVSTNDPVWFIDVKGTNLYCNQLKWTNGFTSKPGFTMTNWAQLPITSSYAPAVLFGAPQFGTSTKIKVDDTSRLTMAVTRTLAGTQYLWTCHNIIVNSNGNNDVIAPDRAAIEWFKICLTSAITNADSSRIYDRAPNNPRSYYCPSLAVNKSGDIAIGFSGSSVNDYVGAYYWGKLQNGVSLNTPTRYHDGQDSVGALLWGDYSFTTLDPVDGLTFWTIQEYAESPSIWGTRITAVRPY
jgi:hypothetical protein